MGTSVRLRVAAAILIAGTLGACGSQSDSTRGARAGDSLTKIGGSPSQQPPQHAKRGGSLTFLSAGDIDFVDPGRTYYMFANVVQNATQRTLYSYEPQDGMKAVPDLAAGPPKIAADKKTITVHLKSGIRFSPPVDRAVTSGDVKYGLERGFSAVVPNGYARSYFGDLVGAPAKPGPVRPISGIQTPDPHTLVLRFAKPSAVLAAQALVMPLTAPVPKEYASRWDRGSLSRYESHVVFTGPYMVRADSSGKLVGRKPGESIDLVRNPNWDAKSDYRPAYLDEIRIDEGNNDGSVAARRALNGSHIVCCDSGTPPASLLRRALSQASDQLLSIPASNTRWMSMNVNVEPFDDIDVRKAIIAAFDRQAMVLTSGGAAAGQVAQGFLPPGLPGFAEAGGFKQNADLDFLRHPRGDMALARQYMKKAGQHGVPVTSDGLYAGTKPVIMVGVNADPGHAAAEVAQAQLAKLGFKVKLRLTSTETMYSKFCMLRSAKAAVCPNVGFSKDFGDAQSVLSPTFAGATAHAEVSSNYSFMDSPAVDAAMNQAAQVPPGPARNRAWAHVNHVIAAQAPAVPWLWDRFTYVQAKDVHGVLNGWTSGLDLSYTSLR
jgi:peptide/nickel transport system substrate-binding protein